MDIRKKKSISQGLTFLVPLFRFHFKCFCCVVFWSYFVFSSVIVMYRVRINYRRISLRHNLSRKCCKIVKFVLITHSERNIWNGPIVATAISREKRKPVLERNGCLTSSDNLYVPLYNIKICNNLVLFCFRVCYSRFGLLVVSLYLYSM